MRVLKPVLSRGGKKLSSDKTENFTKHRMAG